MFLQRHYIIKKVPSEWSIHGMHAASVVNRRTSAGISFG